MNVAPEIDFYKGDVSSVDEIRAKLGTFEGGEITCEKNDSDGIAKICINHPEKRNAISGKMMIDFENIVHDLQKWENGKGVIIYGANDIFCSGGDLSYAKKENTPRSGYEMSIFMQHLTNKFSQSTLVSVAYINGGGAIGGGSEIITACDFRLCCSDEKTKIGFVHSKMGIVPAWGGTRRLVDIVGRRKALDLILTAKLLNNKEALQIGLVDDIVNDFQQAYEWLASRVKAHRSITRAAKASVLNGSLITADEEELERKIFAPLWGGAANKAALQMSIKHK
ncbi:ethylmalonyl-CoA decarboxylase-like [Planococcus citri]|uniref:ethylmalonyl-CoA decarboxylase-like n=1 Tax=Planococcus citri TaxID=170843 RepID=UPI0031F79AC2